MGQDRDGRGKYRTVGSVMLPHFHEESLERHVQYKTSDDEGRQDDILFDQHRKLFGWKTKSDLWRDEAHLGRKLIIEAIPDPDQELMEIYQQNEVMIGMAKSVNRHKHAEQMMDYASEAIGELKDRKNFGAIRDHLRRVLDVCRKTKNPALRQTMEDAFARRFGEMWTDLNKPMSLNPRDYED